MTLYTGPQKSEPAPFAVSLQANGAFSVSLLWKEKESSGGFFGKVAKLLKGGGDDEEGECDLDLYGYVFDGNNRLKAVVGPEENNLTDISGAMFHSGDNTTGGGEGEVITVQSLRIPEDYKNFFFLVRSDARISLDAAVGAQVRLFGTVAGGEAKLENAIQSPAEVAATGYVFCHVSRTEEGWTCRSLDAYTNFDEDWSALLSSFNVQRAA